VNLARADGTGHTLNLPDLTMQETTSAEQNRSEKQQHTAGSVEKETEEHETRGQQTT
jgi:hypothetical protein